MPVHPDLVVSGALVLKSAKAKPERLDIVVRAGRIVGLLPPESADRSDAKIIDGRHKLAIPGLINAHYHSHDVLSRGMFEDIPLEVWIALAILPPTRELTPREVRLRTLIGAIDNLRNGITTVQDMLGCGPGSERHIEAAIKAYSDVGIRCVLALQVGNRPAIDCLPGIRNRLPADLAPILSGPQPTTNSILDFVSAGLAAGNARLTFGIAPGSPQRCTFDLMSGLARLAADRHLPLFTHVNESKLQIYLAGSLYADYGGSVLDYLEAAGALHDRLCMAHGIWFSDDEIDHIASARAAIATCPTSNLKLKNGVAPLRKLKKAGVRLALGADNTSAGDTQNIFEAMKLVCNLNAAKGPEPSTFLACDALSLATECGAEVLGLQDEIGRIEEGMAADLALIDLHDPNYLPLNDCVRQIVYGETGRAVHTVIVEGAIVVEGRKLKTVDFASILDEVADLSAGFQRDCRDHYRHLEPVLPSIMACVREQSEKHAALNRWLCADDVPHAG